MRLPTVLALAGHDPTGGAGLVADAEAIRAMGAWPLTVATTLTRQSSVDVMALTPRPFEEIVGTARTLFEDFRIDAIKVGLIADSEALRAVVAICQAHMHLPIVLDPVLKAGGGCELSSRALTVDFVHGLLPLATLSTPNLVELSRLFDARKTAAENDSIDDDGDSEGIADVDSEHDRARQSQAIEHRARALLSESGGAMLVTGTDVPGRAGGDEVIHRLYQKSAQREWRWPRLAGSFHGSGCTLSSAIAAGLARGTGLEKACEAAQRFTWQSLSRGLCQGSGQKLPDRLLPGGVFAAGTDQGGEPV